MRTNQRVPQLKERRSFHLVGQLSTGGRVPRRGSAALPGLGEQKCWRARGGGSQPERPYVPGSYLAYFTIAGLVIGLSSELQMFCSKKR